MRATAREVMQFVEENDVKFIRLFFCDVFGEAKNVSITAEQLPRAFETGISFDASAVRGFMNVEQSDLFLFPDPQTLSVLPWRPQQGRVVRLFCDIRHPGGQPFEGDGRRLLKEVVESARAQGYVCRIGAECEFYLFELDERGNPTHVPHDQAGYFDMAPPDKGENVRREICLALEDMGVTPESSHHEQGPGQNEIDFLYSDALSAADNLMTFRMIVKTVAMRNGLHASFMPKPIEDKSGSGLHVNMSLQKNGLNVFRNDTREHVGLARGFIAGILGRVGEISAFLNPLTNSYKRFGSYEAPKYVTWSPQNRSQLIRIPAAQGDFARMELRSPDPALNPYLAFALLIRAGLEGIERGLPLCEPCDFNMYAADARRLSGVEKLPESLGEAVALAQGSAFVKAVLPQRTIDAFLGQKLDEWRRYTQAPDKAAFEADEYFLRV